MSTKSLTTDQCNHINARGRRCPMLIAPDQDSLSLQHLRKAAASQPDDAALADELLNSTGDLASVGEITAFLGNVVKRSETCDLNASLTNAAKPAGTPPPRTAESGASCHF